MERQRDQVSGKQRLYAPEMQARKTFPWFFCFVLTLGPHREKNRLFEDGQYLAQWKRVAECPPKEQAPGKKKIQ